MNTQANITTSPGHDGHRASMNKGIAVGALGTAVAAVVIGGAAWFAFTRDDPSVQANTVAVAPGTVANGTAATAAGLAAPSPSTALPPPVYQPAPPQAVARANPVPAPQVSRATPAPATQAPTHVAIAGKPGVVESVREVTVKGDSNGVGAVAGGVVGGLLGNQLGGGSGRTVMTIAGAVGGGFAGNEVQKRINSTKVWNVTVRFDDGTTRTFHENSPSAWRSGDRVRMRDGVLVGDNG